MSLRRSVVGLAGILLISVLVSPIGLAGTWSGTVNASYQRSERDEIRNAADSLLQPASSSEAKQSNLRINYQSVLFSKNLMRLGANYFIQRDELADRWNVRPIYSYYLSSAGYIYTGSYSPRKQTSRLRLPDGTYLETRTYFRDWRNSLSLRYKALPPVIIGYNRSRNFDDEPVGEREVDRRSRYISAQSSYSVGPVSANVIYTNANSRNRRPTSTTENTTRTWQGSTGFAGTIGSIGSMSASYAYLDTRATREGVTSSPASTSNVHAFAVMATSREWRRLTATVGYSGRFLDSRSAGIEREIGDEDFSGQLQYSPLSYFTASATKNYHITSQSMGHQVREYLSFSASFSRFLRRGVDTRLSWTRTYIQRSDETVEIADTAGVGLQVTAGGDNYSDALYFSIAATPYHRAKLLADMSMTRANRPWVESQRYFSSGSMNLSVAMTRNFDGRLSLAYANQGASLDLFSSTYRSVSAGLTYLRGANLNGNLTYSHNSYSTVPRQSSSALSGYLGYTYRNKYSLYLYMNRSRQETITATDTTFQSAIREPRSWSGQLQTKLSKRATLIFDYSRSTALVAGVRSSKTDTFQIIFHGQF